MGLYNDDTKTKRKITAFTIEYSLVEDNTRSDDIVIVAKNTKEAMNKLFSYLENKKKTLMFLNIKDENNIIL